MYTAPLRINEHTEKISLTFLKSGLIETAVDGSKTSGEEAVEEVALSAKSDTRDCSYLIVATELFLIYEQGHHAVRLFNPV